jgi:hypothetical protein
VSTAAPDCVVLGCGRSGTSLVAGLLADAGWHLGERLLAPNADNPRGYFEDLPVNRLNERLLAPVTGDLLRDPDGTPVSARPLAEGERWLAALPPDVELPGDPALAPAIEDAVRAPDGQPVCRKDPRFTWTLPQWAPLAGAVRVVPFREPLAAARSIAAMAGQGTLGLGVEGALAVWASSARRALALADAEVSARWVFVPYEGVVDGSALPALGDAVGRELVPSLVDPDLYRHRADGPVPEPAARLHAELRERAGG